MNATPESRLDWESLRRRLAAASQATADATGVSRDRARRLLDERARSLACAPQGEESPGETVELFTFALGGERYAIETRFVREVCRPPETTPVPAAPEFLAGVANLRGEVLAVMDLAHVLQLPAPSAAAEWLIVLGAGRAEFGFGCQEVSEVRAVPRDALHPAPHGRGLYVQGTTAEAVTVLDGGALLADERLTVED